MNPDLNPQAVPRLHCAGLTRDFGPDRVIDDLDLVLRPGELAVLLGPNGAGKTTLLRLLAGVLEPTLGTASVDGHAVVSARRAAQRLTGFVPDRPPLHPELTVEENLRLAGKLRGIPAVDESIAQVLAEQDLTHAAHWTASSLSKGYRQRAAIASATIHRPTLLLLDEPASGLDPAQRERLEGFLRRYVADGATVLLSTHIVAEAVRWGSRAFVMSAGRLHEPEAEPGIALRVEEHPEVLATTLQGIQEVRSVHQLPNGQLRVVAPRRIHPQIAEAAVSHGLTSMVPLHAVEATWQQVLG